MYVPLVVLAILSVVGGWYLSRPVDEFEHTRLQNWLYPSSLPILGDVPLHPQGIPLMWLSLLAAFGGLACGLVVYMKGLPASEGWNEKLWKPWRLAARNQFGYDAAMVGASVEGGTDVGNVLWRSFDSRLIDGTVNGVAGLFGFIGTQLKRVQTGFARTYALMMLVGVVALVVYVVSQQMGGGH
jgi:NADH-quinone oxidoreductase subunit L